LTASAHFIRVLFCVTFVPISVPLAFEYKFEIFSSSYFVPFHVQICISFHVQIYVQLCVPFTVQSCVPYCVSCWIQLYVPLCLHCIFLPVTLSFMSIYILRYIQLIYKYLPGNLSCPLNALNVLEFCCDYRTLYITRESGVC
jgi:hypothetical protein